MTKASKVSKMPKAPIDSAKEAEQLVKYLTRLVKKIRQDTTIAKRVKSAQFATTEKTVAQFLALGLDCPDELQQLVAELGAVNKAYQDGLKARELLYKALRTLLPHLKKPQKKSRTKSSKPKAPEHL